MILTSLIKVKHFFTLNLGKFTVLMCRVLWREVYQCVAFPELRGPQNSLVPEFTLISHQDVLFQSSESMFVLPVELCPEQMFYLPFVFPLSPSSLSDFWQCGDGTGTQKVRSSVGSLALWISPVHTSSLSLPISTPSLT